MPYKKWNCSKFCEFVLRDKFGINFNFPQTTGTIFAQSTLLKNEIPVYSYYPKKTKNPCDGDLVVMNGLKMLCHIGLYVKIKNIEYVLHAESSFGCSCLHKISDLSFYGYRMDGVYKWQT